MTKEERIIKRRVRWNIYDAIKAGKIKKLPCSVCGNRESQGHHKDYSKQLDVIWLCMKHHKEVHKFKKCSNGHPRKYWYRTHCRICRNNRERKSYKEKRQQKGVWVNGKWKLV